MGEPRTPIVNESVAGHKIAPKANVPEPRKPYGAASHTFNNGICGLVMYSPCSMHRRLKSDKYAVLFGTGECVSLRGIPVILSDHFELPFPEQIDWASAAVLWPERDVESL